MPNPNRKYRSRPVLTDMEISIMLTKADGIPDEYFRLRVKALIALVKKFGKRRSEIASLQREDLKVEPDGFLYVTFTIRKKHKRGLFQYLKYLQKQIRDEKLSREFVNSKQLAELNEEWREWQKTEEGCQVKEEKRTKKLALEDKYCRLIIEYADFLKAKYPDAKFLFPSGRTVFGQSYMVYGDRHLSGRQLLRLIKLLNPKAWLHLFRETKGAEIARTEGNKLTTVYEIRDTLDLEKEETAYRYVRRYAVQEIPSET